MGISASIHRVTWAEGNWRSVVREMIAIWSFLLDLFYFYLFTSPFLQASHGSALLSEPTAVSHCGFWVSQWAQQTALCCSSTCSMDVSYSSTPSVPSLHKAQPQGWVLCNLTAAIAIMVKQLFPLQVYNFEGLLHGHKSPLQAEIWQTQPSQGAVESFVS